MRNKLEQALLQKIQRERMLPAGSRVAVAVSGGADSVALLRLLEPLRDALGIALLVTHFNHSLRGAQSEGDCEFVKDLALAHGLEIVVDCADVRAQAEREGLNLEDTARRLRYAFFDRVVLDGHASHIAVAHTADDQAETILAHLIRGTGLTGLAGIYPVAGVVVRPLLGARRGELRDYLRSIGQPWREDSTNTDIRRMRARIRAELLPLLERDFSPAITNHLSELARFAREEEIFWEALTEDRFHALAAREANSVRIRVDDLLGPLHLCERKEQQPTTAKFPASPPLRMLTERLIRRLYQEIRGDRKGLGSRHVEQVIRLASESNSGGRAELPGGITVQRNFRDVRFSMEAVGRPALGEGVLESRLVYEYSVDLPLRNATSVSVPELGKCFRLKVIDWPIAESDTKGDANAIDADLLHSPLILRNWRPGDAYRPHGRRREQKLKQMFVAGRIRSDDRAGWPVLESAGRVVWVQGMPPAANYRARSGTKRGVVIEEQVFEDLLLN
ncbi:MAG: tRNA lysidine(34) synthetase TilS [Candidatus Acidiferrales bacterium]